MNRNALTTARTALTAKGWIFVYSVMKGEKTDTNYGMCFTKDGAWFYLNVETIGQVGAL